MAIALLPALFRRPHMRSAMAAVEIARQQPCSSARGAADQFEIGFGHAREVIVDDDGGIAAARPTAVASSASAMPGATTARLVVCDFEMPMKLFIMPQTVPNRPTNGAVAPMVANSPMADPDPARFRRG